MAIEAKWCGIDFGQCLMDPSGLRNHLVIGDVCKELGEPELDRAKSIFPRTEVAFDRMEIEF